MFVLAVENGAFECGLKLVDGGFCNVIGDLLGMFGDLLGMFGPEVVA